MNFDNNIKWILILALCAGGFAWKADAADLKQSYERAKENDPQWAAARSVYLAEQFTEKRGRAGMLPRLMVSARKSNNTYESDAQQYRFSDKPPDTANIVGCLSQGIAFVGCVINESIGLTVTDNVKERFTSTEYQASFTQPIMEMDNYHDWQKTKALTNKSEAEYDLASQDLIVRVGKAYFDVLRSVDDMAFAEQEEAAIRKQLRLVTKRYEQGLDREKGVYDAQAASDTQKASLAVASSALQIAYRGLAAVTGIYDTDIVRISEDIPIDLPLPATGEEWVQQALAHNASLVSARFSVDAAEQDYKAKRAAHLPTLDLYASYSESTYQGGQGFLPQSKSTSIGVELQMPIYQGGFVSASRKYALFRHQEAKDRLTQQRWSVEAGTLNIHLTVTADVQRYNAFRRSIESSKNAYRSTKQSYQSGISQIGELLRAQQDMYRAQRELAHSRYDYIVDSLKLKQAAGILREDDLLALNKWMDYSDVRR